MGSELGLSGKVLEVFPGIESAVIDLVVLLVNPHRECGDRL